MHLSFLFLVFFRKLFNPFEKKNMKWVLSQPVAERKRISFRTLLQYRLESRLRSHIRNRKAGDSFKTAFRSGLQNRITYAALLAAIIRVFGMSWYFDTENWAIRNLGQLGCPANDAWRNSNGKIIDEKPSATSFLIHPPGVMIPVHFSFLIIGDPGEEMLRSIY
jgi:hypothetical protein